MLILQEAYQSSRHHAASRLLAGFALATLSLTTLAEAQPYGPGRGGTDHMMGPAMMDRQLFGRMCGPRTAGFAEWQLDRLERVIKPTDAQRAKFDEFKAASNKAAEAMRAACPTDVPTTMVGRMEAMEKRLEAMLQAVKTVRPALDAFYATLSDEQKADLNGGSGPRTVLALARPLVNWCAVRRCGRGLEAEGKADKAAERARRLEGYASRQIIQCEQAAYRPD